MTIGERISELRKAKGYTQEYVAECLGVSRQAVSKWEKDLTSPDTKNLIALAQLLDTSIEYIAVGEVRSEQAKKDRSRQLSIINSKISTGNVLVIFGLILLFVFPLIGLIMLVVGIVYLVNAYNLRDELPDDLNSKPKVLKSEALPWTCYSCGNVNDGSMGYCGNCHITKGWSAMMQEKEKK